MFRTRTSVISAVILKLMELSKLFILGLFAASVGSPIGVERKYKYKSAEAGYFAN